MQQKDHRETLIDTYEDVVLLGDLLEHPDAIDHVFNSLYKGKELENLADHELVQLINWTLKTLLSLKA